MADYDKNDKYNNKGFSLVELIIVIAIMAILIGVMAPQLIGYIYKTKRVKDAHAASVIKEASEYANTFGDIPVNDPSFQPIADGYFTSGIESNPNLVYCAWNQSAAAYIDMDNPSNFLEYTMAEIGILPESAINGDFIWSIVFDRSSAQCVAVFLTDNPSAGYDKYELYPNPDEYIAHGPNK